MKFDEALGIYVKDAEAARKVREGGGKLVKDDDEAKKLKPFDEAP